MEGIIGITAYPDSIAIALEGAIPQGVAVCPYPGNGDFDPGLHRSVAHEGAGNTLYIPRYEGGRDRLYDRFAVLHGGDRLPGPCRVTGMETPAWDFPYPTADTLKGLQVRMIDDAVALGAKHAAINISQPSAMLPRDNGDAIAFASGGRVFYFNRDYIQRFDRRVQGLSGKGFVVNLILLNSMLWDGVRAHPEIEALVAHPDYDREGFISAFNTVTGEGLAHYIAFVEFVASRYMRPDARYGRACGLIVGNEVNSHWVWGNAGLKTAQAYVAQYAVALRTTYLAARKYYAHPRVYVSLDHYWTLRHMEDEEKTHGGRETLDRLAALSRQEGDYPWAVAYHPYPEDLNNPDFWNDKTTPCHFDAGRITFKNLEVLAAYLDQPGLLYQGQRRRIILSEQGFNSKETQESELLQRAAYCLAYRKVEAVGGIDAFILHAHVDNRDEFGLNLGLWRRDKDSGKESLPHSPKPIYDAFRDIDTPRGEAHCRSAMQQVGEDVWEDILRIRECS